MVKLMLTDNDTSLVIDALFKAANVANKVGATDLATSFNNLSDDIKRQQDQQTYVIRGKSYQ